MGISSTDLALDVEETDRTLYGLVIPDTSNTTRFGETPVQTSAALVGSSLSTSNL